ncbi:MAG: FAD:protein FMN transferase [Woeseia sp.]
MLSKPNSGNTRWLICSVLVALQLAACQPAPQEFSDRIAAFGTLITLRYYGVAEAEAAAATRALEGYFRSIENDWYPWGNGELQRINEALASGQSTPVSQPLANLLQRATDLERRSDGLFNPALGALSELWGFNDLLQDDWQPPAHAAIAELLQHDPGSRHLHWSGHTLRSDNRYIVLDPGGIAKGAILASSARILSELGIANAIVDIGGDLIVRGYAGQRAARIGIRSPGSDSAIGWLEAAPGEAIVTSGNYERYFEFDGIRYNHVLDPRTGYPVAASASVTVAHADPVLADAAATALLVAGPNGFDALCAALGIEQALLITASGDLRLTPALQARVHWLDEDDARRDSGRDVSQ